MKQFFKPPLSITQIKVYVEEQVFNTDETGSFYKDIDKQIYTIIMQMVFGWWNVVTRGAWEPNMYFPQEQEFSTC